MFRKATLRINDGPILLAGQLGLEFSNPFQAEWERLAELLGVPRDSPAVVYFNKRAYLPRIYQHDGKPVLVWEGKGYAFKPSRQLEIVYAAADTNGYAQQAHAVCVFSMDDSSVQSSDDVVEIALPVATLFDKESNQEFLKMSKVRPTEAFKTWVRQPDPTSGLTFIDEVYPNVDALEVLVEGLIVRTSEQYGNTYSIARVTINGETLKVRCGRDVTSLAEMGLVFPQPVTGYLKRGKTYLNLVSIELTKENVA